MLGKEISPYVAAQINIRQKKLGLPKRETEDLSILNSKTCWVKMASSVNVTDTAIWDDTSVTGENSGISIPKKYVLFNGTSEQTTSGKPLKQRSGIKKEGSYDTLDPDFGIVPMPGLTSLKIDSKTNGMIKIANVSLLANSRQQFEIMNVLFLKLGYNVLIEYGWSFYYDNGGNKTKPLTTLIEREWFDQNNDDKNYQYWLEQIKKKKKTYVGNYGAVFGRIMNFNWKFNRDGSYSIDLKIMTHGDIAESLKSKPNTGIHSKKNTIKISTYLKDMLKDKDLQQGLTGKKNGSLTVEQLSPEFSELTQVDLDGDGEIDSNKIEYQISPTPNQDRLSEHLFHLQLLGCGFNNYIVNNKDMEGKTSFGLKLGEVSDGSGVITDFNYELSGLGDEGGITQLPPIGYSFYTDPNLRQELKDDGRYFGGIIHNESGDAASVHLQKDVMFINFEHGQTEEETPTELFSPMDQPVYVRLQYLLYYIQKRCLNKTKKGDALVNIDYIDPIPMYVPRQLHCALSYTPSKYIISNYHYDNSYLSPEPGYIDAANVIAKAVAKLRSSLLEDGKLKYINDPNKSHLYYGLEPGVFNIPGTDPSTHVIMANNIYCNISNIISQLPLEANSNNEMRVSIFKLLEIICNEINQSFGGINNLEPIVDEATNTIKIIDSTNMPYKDKIYEFFGLKNQTPESYLLQLYGFRKFGGHQVSNFVRNVDLSTTIPKNMASMIAIGATFRGKAPGEDSTAFSKLNQGTEDRFGVKLEQTDEDGEIPNTGLDIEEIVKDAPASDNIQKGTGKLSLLAINQPGGVNAYNDKDFMIPSFDADFESHNISTINTFYKEQEGYVGEITPTGGSPSMGFLPFRMSITMDGIEGLNIYEGLKIDSSFLPKVYPDSMEFVIMGVSHDFPRGDWTTTVRLSSLPKQDDKNIPVSQEAGNFGSKGTSKKAPVGSGGQGGGGGGNIPVDPTNIKTGLKTTWTYDQVRSSVINRFGTKAWDENYNRVNIVSVNQYYKGMANTNQEGGAYNAYYDDQVLVAYKTTSGEKGVTAFITTNKPSYVIYSSTDPDMVGRHTVKTSPRGAGFMAESWKKYAYSIGTFRQRPALKARSGKGFIPGGGSNTITGVGKWNLYRMKKNVAQWAKTGNYGAGDYPAIYNGLKNLVEDSPGMHLHAGAQKHGLGSKANYGYSAGCNVFASPDGDPGTMIKKFVELVDSYPGNNAKSNKRYNHVTILSKYMEPKSINNPK